jgi:hypothetical protein
MGLLVLLVGAQIVAKKFHPVLNCRFHYLWYNYGRFFDRSLGIGYPGGSALLLALLLATLALDAWINIGGNRQYTEGGSVLWGGHHLFPDIGDRSWRLDGRLNGTWL